MQRPVFSAALLALFAAMAVADPRYRVTVTDLPGEEVSTPAGINASGQVVGSALTYHPWGGGVPFAGPPRAFLFSGGVARDLGTLGGDSARAVAVNGAGQVVGTSSLADGSSRPFLYSGGAMRDFLTQAGVDASYAEALDINGPGTVVGSLYANGRSRAYAYQNGVVSDLGTFGGTDSYATAVNDAGAVAGVYVLGSETRAFLYANGGFTDVPGLRAVSGLNGAGQIVGWRSGPNSSFEAAVYENGAVRGLGTLGGDLSYAFGINAAGDVVGDAKDASGVRRGFVYTGGAMTDLSTLVSGYTIATATGINDGGQIAAVGFGADGRSHALLLTPVPEPASLAALALGAAALCRRRRPTAL